MTRQDNISPLPPLPTSEAADDVLRAVRSAPQLTLERGWQLVRRPDAWAVLPAGDDVEPHHRQPHLLSCGSAVEHVVVALQAQGHRVEVQLFPPTEPTAVATVHVVGPGPATAVDHALRAACDPATRPPAQGIGVRPSDLRELNLAVEAFGVEALWSSDLAARRELKGLQRVGAVDAPRPMVTLVTSGDDRHDWVQAGRALAHLLLKAATLGLTGRMEPHSLRLRSTREAVRTTWDLRQWPQVQLTLGPADAAQRPEE